jgi:hypothetical protein
MGSALNGGLHQLGDEYVNQSIEKTGLPNPFRINSTSQIISTVYNFITKKKKVGKAIVADFGVPVFSMKDVPTQYLVGIVDKDMDRSGEEIARVWAVLQDEVKLSTGSNWEGFDDLQAPGLGSELKNAAESAAQIFGKSLKTTWSTRRMWKGTEPVSLTLSLKFEAMDDAFNEVVAPCMKLQSMSLPSDTGMAGFLAPPGPSPFKLGKSGINKGEEITIYIGMYLIFKSVIIKDVQITMGNKIDKSGNPISAQAFVTFQTYEILTKQALETVYGNKKEAETYWSTRS